jgi:hypothetical protein
MTLTYFFQVYHGVKSCNSLLDNMSYCTYTQYYHLLTFSVCSSNKHCLSARCLYAANTVRKDLDIFAIGAVSLNNILPIYT